MNDWLDDLRLAVGMLTRVPVPHPDGPAPSYLPRAHRVFPIVGAAIGAAIGLVYVALAAIGLPAMAGAALALGAGMLLTGGFHEDGLADLADGFGGGRDRAAKLEIMRDSRLGTFGALALLVAFAAKVAAMVALAPSFAVAGLIAAHALSRGPLAAVTLFLPYARPDGLAAAGKIEPPIAAIAAAVAAVIAAVCLPLSDALLAVVVTVAAVAAIAALAKRQIGGYTGDVLGAAQQVAETAVLLLLAVRHGIA